LLVLSEDREAATPDVVERAPQRLVLEEASPIRRDAVLDAQPPLAGATLDVGDFHRSLLS
jgi:hypothetical protein